MKSFLVQAFWLLVILQITSSKILRSQRQRNIKRDLSIAVNKVIDHFKKPLNCLKRRVTGVKDWIKKGNPITVISKQFKKARNLIPRYFSPKKKEKVSPDPDKASTIDNARKNSSRKKKMSSSRGHKRSSSGLSKKHLSELRGQKKKPSKSSNRKIKRSSEHKKLRDQASCRTKKNVASVYEK